MASSPVFSAVAEAPVIFGSPTSRIAPMATRRMACRWHDASRPNRCRNRAVEGCLTKPADRRKQGGHGKTEGVELRHGHPTAARCLRAPCLRQGGKGQPSAGRRSRRSVFPDDCGAAFTPSRGPARSRAPAHAPAPRPRSKSRQRGLRYLNFKSCVHHIYPCKAAAAHPARRLAAPGGLRGSSDFQRYDRGRKAFVRFPGLHPGL